MMSEAEKGEIERIKTFTNEEIKKMNIEELKSQLKKIQDISVQGNKLIKIQQKEIEELKKPKYIINEKTKQIKLMNDFISKDKIRELKQSIHNTLDENGISRGYQQIIDKYFDELLEEN